MVKQRNIVLAIVLSLITCGIYGIVWFISLTNDMNTITGKQETSGGLAFVYSLITCGIYSLFWSYKMGKNMDEINANKGMNAGSNYAVLFLVLQLFGFGIVNYAIIQNELNNY